jgi:hypothetical protein
MTHLCFACSIKIATGLDSRHTADSAFGTEIVQQNIMDNATFHFTEIYLLVYAQFSKWAGICRYNIPELIFVHAFRTGTYATLYALILSHFFDGISLYRL